MLTTHRNAFHDKNIYIDFENEDISSLPSFRKIADKYGAPLQMMLDCQHLIVQSKIERTNLRLTNNF